jgi:excisionase family DNA binding protein
MNIQNEDVTMTETTSRQRVYSIQRTAEELGVCDKTIRRLIADGKIKAVRLSVRRLGIPASELDRIVTEGVA